MTRVNNILRISELKWTGMGEFNSDDHYIYYYGQESLRRNGVALMKWSEFGQSCPTLCNPMDCIPPGSSIHGIFQAGVLEWIAISFSSWSSWSGYQTQVSHISGRRFTIWATRGTVLGCNLKNNRIISVRLQGKSFNVIVIQVYASTTDAEEAKVNQIYEDL